MTKYTNTPWMAYKNCIQGNEFYGDFPKVVAIVMDMVNAERACACVNACVGIDPEAVPDLLEALETIARLPIARAYPDGPCIDHHDMQEVLAAIAKAKGETND